jgi:spermidine synthase
MMTRTMLAFGTMAALATCVIAVADRQTLYQKDSPYNTIVVTEDDQGLRTLRFETYGARQSVVKVGDPDHLELPYARGMFLSVAFCPQPKRALVVGLGGGTIPSFLHKHYPRAVIDAVDIDPDVVDVAKKYFGFREDKYVRAYVEDGRSFIERQRGIYDIVFLDAFSSDEIPYHLATREFLQAVRNSLTADGIVAANVWSRASNRLYDSMVRTYQDVFA